MEKEAKIYVSGHRGLVGSAIMRRLKADGYNNIVVRTHQELDLTRQSNVEAFFDAEKPEYVFLIAAKVGGISFLTQHEGETFYENTLIACNVINSSARNAVKKLIFIGGTSIYPRFAALPVQESSLLTGELEPTVEAYGLAKIVGVKLCKYYNNQYGTNFISIAAPNLYGCGDNDNLKTGHVMPSLIRKFAEAVRDESPFVEVWGTGNACREFLHTEDLADACVFLMNHYDRNEVINVGSGTDISIRELAELLKRISGYKGDIRFDASKPDGVMKRVTDSSKIFNLGWRPKISLEEGVKEVYEKYFVIKNGGPQCN